jgi:hypothetical protein
MNAVSKIVVANVPNLLRTFGEQTYRYAGVEQWPMTVDQQKKAGLIAVVSVGIHPNKRKRAQQAQYKAAPHKQTSLAA